MFRGPFVLQTVHATDILNGKRETKRNDLNMCTLRFSRLLAIAVSVENCNFHYATKGGRRKGDWQNGNQERGCGYQKVTQNEKNLTKKYQKKEP